MSNPNFPTGLTPVQHINGAPWNGQTVRCYLDGSSNSVAYFVGDPVVMYGSADTLGTSPSVVLATAGNTHPIAGVITSFEPVDPTGGNVSGNLNLQIIYCPASTKMYVNVCIDPTVLYEVMGDDTSAIAATDVGSNIDLVAFASGSTSTGYSGWALDSDAKAVTASYQMRIWSASPTVGNDISSVYARWLCLINLNQLFSAGVATVGTAIAGGVGV